MNRTWIFPIGLLTATMLEAAEPSANPFVAPGATVETVADRGFTFLEGPACAPNGDLYFADIREDRIYRYDVAAGKVNMVLENSGGVNGMQFDARGRLIGCQGTHRRLIAYHPETMKVVETYPDQYEGKRFNKPNDLWIDPGGGIYFTDPNYSRADKTFEMDGRFVYYIKPDGKTILRLDKYNKPNGIV
ncbi:MAG: SMP-30/gluconolactonase/LRE family protein, partial [Verrucomicrobiota bacterium]